MAEIEKNEAEKAPVSEKAVTEEKSKKAVAAKPKKDKVPLKEKIAKFFRDYKSELKKISWCQPKDLLKMTVIVLVSVLIVSVCVGALDFGFSRLIVLLGNLY